MDYLTPFQLEDIADQVDAGKTSTPGSLITDLARIQFSQKYEFKESICFQYGQPVRELLNTYPALAHNCTEDLKTFLRNNVVVKKGKTSHARIKKAQAIDRYLKSAVREGIRPD